MIIVKTLPPCSTSADPVRTFDKKRCEDGKLIHQGDVEPYHWLAHGEPWSWCCGNWLLNER